MATTGGWIDQRSGAVPPRLSARLGEALGDRVDVPRGEAAAVCIDAADALLRDLLARGSTGRDLALDLLTVDALATYAFEAAASDPATLKALATAAAARFAAAAID
jgi:hypothetical protein